MSSVAPPVITTALPQTYTTTADDGQEVTEVETVFVVVTADGGGTRTTTYDGSESHLLEQWRSDGAIERGLLDQARDSSADWLQSWLNLKL